MLGNPPFAWRLLAERYGIAHASIAGMLKLIERLGGAESVAEIARLRAENEQLRADVEQRAGERAELFAAKGAKEREVEHLVREKTELLAANKEQAQEIARLKHSVDRLARRLFGSSSEKIDPNQLNLVFPDAEAAAAEAAKVPTPAAGSDKTPDSDVATPEDRRRERKKGAHGRKPFPSTVLRKRVDILVPEKDRRCECCGDEKQRIGFEVTERMGYDPACFHVVEEAREKLACMTGCDGSVVTAPLPPHPIAGGRPTAGVLGYFVTSKFADHLPLHRLEAITARHGIEIARSTMCDWLLKGADLLFPIYSEMRKSALRAAVLQVDDTGVRLKAPGKGKTKSAALWAYSGECGDVVFDFTLDRKKEGPLAFTAGFGGKYLQGDAYSGYQSVCKALNVLEVGCWSHGRRGFYDAVKTSPEPAAWALATIGGLYRIEDAATEKKLVDGARAAYRLEHAKPLLDDFFRWADEQAKVAFPASPLGEALTYVRNQREELLRYVEDGRISIDNNRSERNLRLVAVGRKNWLFCGSKGAGRAAAIYYSFVVSCRELKIEPFFYLRDIFDRVSTHPARLIAELTPRGWLAARPTTTPPVPDAPSPRS